MMYTIMQYIIGFQLSNTAGLLELYLYCFQQARLGLVRAGPCFACTVALQKNKCYTLAVRTDGTVCEAPAVG